jgi:hypothetical protein
MTTGFASNAAHMSTQPEPCSFCSSTKHQVNNCHIAVNYTDVSNEQVNAAFSKLGNDPYSNTYNPGWRNHPNFSWKSPNTKNSTPGPHNQTQSNRQPYNSSHTYQPSHKQYHDAPPLRADSNFKDRMLNMLGEIKGEMINMVGELKGEMTNMMGEIKGKVREIS